MLVDPRLKSLLAVYEAGSFTKAAQRLALTQPAVSQHVRQLEEELGVKVFNRGEAQLALTPEGRVVVRYAQRILALCQNLTQSIQDLHAQRTSLTVGITPTEESSLVAQALARYCAENDGVHITIVSDTITNLYEKLRTYQVDLAIYEGRAPGPAFSSILLDTDCLMLVVPPKSPLARKSMVTIQELKQQKLILRLPSSGTRNLFVAHLESRGMTIADFNVILEVDNIATIKDLIRRGFGVSILAKSACQDELGKGKLKALPIEDLSMTREVQMVYPRDFDALPVLDGIARTYWETAQLLR